MIRDLKAMGIIVVFFPLYFPVFQVSTDDHDLLFNDTF